jgi:hypothetical protein
VDFGFTVPFHEDQRDLDVLCRRYESADARARKEMREALDARIRRPR